MSQRNSGYERLAADKYETPAWCTQALLPFLPDDIGTIWEPAAGSGQMAAVLRDAGYDVRASDIESGQDFLSTVDKRWRAIVTNPPFNQAQRFIEHALKLVGSDGIVGNAITLRLR